MKLKLTSLAIMLIPFVMMGQDSCAVFGNGTIQPMMMGYMPQTVEWKTINYVIHIHYTDSFPDSYLPIDIVQDAAVHLNEEFEEASINFDLIDIEYHDFDEFELSGPMLQPYNTCVPYSGFASYYIEDYLLPINWDRESFMNVHIFPQFCSGILGFAWTAYTPNTEMEGVWVRSDVFGRYGDHLTEGRDGNKTLIHEVGHYVSLHHVFRGVEFCGEDLGDCLETGDFVCDTPPTKLNWSCENPICPPGLYDYEPNNHMDYYPDSCRTNFTSGQIERIHAALPILRPGLTDPEPPEEDPICTGDLNGDHVVGMVDLMLMLENWGNPDYVEGDLNNNGYFNVIDFSILLGQWGTICQVPNE